MGAILLTASHNPGGPTEDFGIKFNGPNGGPALESLTNLVFEKSTKITEYRKAPVPHIPLNVLNETKGQVMDGDDLREYTVSVIDSCSDYVALMKTLFDFE